MSKYLLFFTLLIFTSCTQATQQMQTELDQLKEKLATTEKALAEANEQTAFIHTVYFWMKPEITAEQKADFVANGMKKLAKAPTLHKVYFGPPAGTDREVVDNSYDFAWICHFKNAADQDAYQVEPIHLKFVEDYQYMWERVQVYDNVLSE